MEKPPPWKLMRAGRGGGGFVCLPGQTGFDGAVKKYSWIDPGALLTVDGIAIPRLGLGGSGQERYRSSIESRCARMRYRCALFLRAERDGEDDVDATLYYEEFFCTNGRTIDDSYWCYMVEWCNLLVTGPD